MGAPEIRRLKQLEDEDSKLKLLLAALLILSSLMAALGLDPIMAYQEAMLAEVI